MHLDKGGGSLIWLHCAHISPPGSTSQLLLPVVCSVSLPRFLGLIFDLPLDYFLVEFKNVTGHGFVVSFQNVCRNIILPETTNRVYFLAVLNLRNLLYLISGFVDIF